MKQWDKENKRYKKVEDSVKDKRDENNGLKRQRED